MKHEQLNGQIALNVIETDRFKTGMLSVNLIVPVKQETAALHTLLLRVLTQGSANYPTLAAVNTRLDDLYAAELGGRNYKRGELQILGLSIDMLENEYIYDDIDVLGGSINMIAELLLNPLLDEKGCFTAKIVEREKKALCDIIRAQINNKGNYAHQRCVTLMCADEPYGLPLTGTVEEVETITPAALTERYHALLREAKVEIYYVGRCSADILREKLTAVFAGYPSAQNAPAPVPETIVIRHADSVREITEEQAVAQGKLVLGFRSGYAVADPDYINFMVFCELFGGSPASKLFLNVREKLSLCYYCHSSPDSYKGLMFVSSGVDPANRDRALDEIMAQLEAVRRGEISDEELDGAVKSLENAYRQLCDRPSGMESYYLGRSLFGVNTTIEEMERSFRRVSAADVAEAARRASLDTVYFLCGAKAADAEEEGETEDDE